MLLAELARAEMKTLFHAHPDFALSALWIGLKDRQGKQTWMTFEDWQNHWNEEREAAKPKEKPKKKGQLP